MPYKAENIPEQRKQLCTELIEKGMAYCGECTAETIDNNLDGVCIKHLKMYGTLYP